MERPVSHGRRQFGKPFVVPAPTISIAAPGSYRDSGPAAAGKRGKGSAASVKSTMRAFEGLAMATKSLRGGGGYGGKMKGARSASYDLFSDNNNATEQQHMIIQRGIGDCGGSMDGWSAASAPQHMMTQEPSANSSDLKLIRGRYYDFDMMQRQVSRAMSAANGGENESVGGSTICSSMYGYATLPPPPPLLRSAISSDSSCMSSLSGGNNGRGWRVPQVMFERGISSDTLHTSTVNNNNSNSNTVVAATPKPPTLPSTITTKSALGKFCMAHVNACRAAGLPRYYPAVFIGNKDELLSKFVTVQRILQQRRVQSAIRFLPPKKWLQEQDSLKMAYSMAGMSCEDEHHLFVAGDRSMLAYPCGRIIQVDLGMAMAIS